MIFFHLYLLCSSELIRNERNKQGLGLEVPDSTVRDSYLYALFQIAPLMRTWHNCSVHRHSGYVRCQNW